MNTEQSVRIDKYLWAVRIFKTRSMASEACRKGRVIVNNIAVKPSFSIARNQYIQVRKLPVTYTYEVLELLENRISAKDVQGFIRDHTPEEEKNKLLNARNNSFGLRPKGTGRPTKKERRTIDRLNFTNLHAISVIVFTDIIFNSIKWING